MTSGVPSSSPRSHRGRRAGLTALLAGALVAGGVTAASSAGPAAAADPVTYPFSDIVTIETSGSKTAAKYYFPDNTTEPRSQGLNVKNCALPVTGPPSSGPVVTLTATVNGAASNVGVYGGSVGAAEKASSNGQSCSQVNTGSTRESLTLALVGKSASLAVLDVEVQKNVVIDAIAMSGGDVVGTFKLYTGTAAVPQPLPAGASVCKVGETSSAPNSNSSDNCKWQLTTDQKFDTLKLTPAAGSTGQFSLEGGSDWTGGALAASGGLPANASYFWLGELCTESETQLNRITIGNATGLPTTISTWQRLPYNADGSPCLSSSVEEVSQTDNLVYFKKGKNQPFAQYLFEIEWNVPAGAIEEATTIDFELNGENGQVPMTWCPDSLWSDDGSTLEGLKSAAEFTAAALPDYDFVPGNGITQYACTFGKKVTSYSKAKGYTFVEQIYILGDAYARR